MTGYRRAKVSGATYFFTVNCAERHDNYLLLERIDLLRQVVRRIKKSRPFEIDAMVVLPDHLHCIWTLPPDDADYKTRWTLIKAGFSRDMTAELNTRVNIYVLIDEAHRTTYGQ